MDLFHEVVRMSEEFIWLSGTLFVILGGIIGVGITAVYKLYAYARAGDALLHDKLECQERHRDLIERLSSLHK